jgi:hypothetical protein
VLRIGHGEKSIMRLPHCIFEALVRLPAANGVYVLYCREARSIEGNKFLVALLAMLLSSPGAHLVTSEKGSDGENGDFKGVAAENHRRLSVDLGGKMWRDEKREERKTTQAIEWAKIDQTTTYGLRTTEAETATLASRKLASFSRSNNSNLDS